MNLVHVVAHVDDEASGPSYSVPRLCQQLASSGSSVELICLSPSKGVPGVKVTEFPPWRMFPRFGISPALATALRDRAESADVVHNHSLWAMPNVAAGWIVGGSRAKLVTSPRGTLSPWALARSKWRKKALWPLQRKALVAADLIHATSPEEYANVRQLGLRNPVAIIPNGVDLPGECKSPRPPAAARNLLFLGRLHPVKGLDLLLRAWQELEPQFPDWRLTIAGRGEPEHEASLRKQAAALALKRAEFVGPRFGEEKTRTFREADLFVLPSHTENFGQVVAEALAHGVPAVVSKGAPWAALEAEGCGWWVENNPEALASALKGAMMLSHEALADRGRLGREWMDRDYGWGVIATRMSHSYEWMVSGGKMPPWIRLA